MEIVLKLKKSLDENAAKYFEEAKKAKKKIAGAKESVIKWKQELGHLEKKEARVLEELEKKQQEKVKIPVKWYHKFRWFITSDGFLAVGGRDATTNEILIKKHVDKDDLVFHTAMSGSPFFILKTEGKKPSKTAIEEIADATVTFSKAWKLGFGAEEVYYVSKEQVSKTAKAGEYLTKGAFMIYGKKNFVENKVNCAIGILSSGEIMAGPQEAVKAQCKTVIEVVQNNEKVSATAKKIQKRIGGDLDTIIRVLPSGGCKIK